MAGTVQLVSAPGYLLMITDGIGNFRIIPIIDENDPRPQTSHAPSYQGSSVGHWEGDTLVVEVTNFNGRVPYRGSGENMKLTERFTRVGPDMLEYMFTIEDPTVWTEPWTGVFPFVRDDGLYEIVEYACHEGNYAMQNILTGARAADREAGQAAD